jgi:integrase
MVRNARAFSVISSKCFGFAVCAFHNVQRSKYRNSPIHSRKEFTMFSQWFSGDDCERYQASLYKDRSDHVGSSLLKLRYGSEVVRQRLHEWLRFSLHLEKNGSALLTAATTEAVRRYLGKRTQGSSASRSRGLRASVRIFLEADEQGRFRRRVGSPPSTPAWFAPILTPYLQFVGTHRGLAEKTKRKYIQKLSRFASYLEGAGIRELGGITPAHVCEFYENAAGGVPRRSYGSTLRAFFRWAAAQGWVSNSPGDAIPRPRQYRYVSLPDVLSQSDVDGILASVDRSRPLGRRD